MSFVHSRLCKSVALTLIGGTLLSGCAQSSVGGSVNYRSNGDESSQEFNVYCNGQCAEFSPDGRCVKFTSGISDVCVRYFERVSRANVITDDCATIINNNSGTINVTRNAECNKREKSKK